MNEYPWEISSLDTLAPLQKRETKGSSAEEPLVSWFSSSL
jgi:hypothetical protein